MNIVDDFIRGNSVSPYVYAKGHFYYQIDLGDVLLILHDYLDDYRKLSVTYTRINPDVVGFYVKGLDKFVTLNSHYAEHFEENSTIECLNVQTILNQIIDELEKRYLSNLHVEARLQDEVIDKLYNKFDVTRFFLPFLLDKEQFHPGKLAYYIREKELDVQKISDYLKHPQTLISNLANELMVNKAGESFIQAWERELMYRRYKKFHSERQTYNKEQNLIHVLQNDLKGAKKIWLILNDGTEKQVSNRWEIESTHIQVGGWGEIGDWVEQVSSDDIRAIRFNRTTFELPKAEGEKI